MRLPRYHRKRGVSDLLLFFFAGDLGCKIGDGSLDSLIISNLATRVAHAAQPEWSVVGGGEAVLDCGSGSCWFFKPATCFRLAFLIGDVGLGQGFVGFGLVTFVG